MSLSATDIAPLRPPTPQEQIYILAGRLGDVEYEVLYLKKKCKLLAKKEAGLREVVGALAPALLPKSGEEAGR